METHYTVYRAIDLLKGTEMVGGTEPAGPGSAARKLDAIGAIGEAHGIK